MKFLVFIGYTLVWLFIGIPLFLAAAFLTLLIVVLVFGALV